MFSEYDSIVAKRRLSENVPKGTKGIILIIYEDKKHYEVEFLDEKGNTLSVQTVGDNDIVTRLDQRPVTEQYEDKISIELNKEDIVLIRNMLFHICFGDHKMLEVEFGTLLGFEKEYVYNLYLFFEKIMNENGIE